MSKNEEDNLIELMKAIHQKTEDQHAMFTTSINEIKTTLDRQTEQLNELKPVADVYKAFAGFGSIAQGFLKWVIIPSSIVIGLFLSIRNLFK